MQLVSSAFRAGEKIPIRYTCEGENVSPELSWTSGPAEIRTEAAWGQGERDAAGYQDRGTSELTYEGGVVLGGLEEHPNRGTAASRQVDSRGVRIPINHVELQGSLAIPELAQGIVLFAHGSGSSRHSPRNRYVAEILQNAGFATLLMDLLTSDEEHLDSRTGALRFDIELLAKRLTAATWWLVEQDSLTDLPIGYFGASTGAAAALVAASGQADLVSALVSRGGRPDLANSALDRVMSPTLLIVGGHDSKVLELNRRALARIPAQQKKLEVIPGASHLFEEEGALEMVAKLAKGWFERYLANGRIGQRAA